MYIPKPATQATLSHHECLWRGRHGVTLQEAGAGGTVRLQRDTKWSNHDCPMFTCPAQFT